MGREIRKKRIGSATAVAIFCVIVATLALRSHPTWFRCSRCTQRVTTRNHPSSIFGSSGYYPCSDPYTTPTPSQYFPVATIVENLFENPENRPPGNYFDETKGISTRLFASTPSLILGTIYRTASSTRNVVPAEPQRPKATTAIVAAEFRKIRSFSCRKSPMLARKIPIFSSKIRIIQDLRFSYTEFGGLLCCRRARRLRRRHRRASRRRKTEIRLARIFTHGHIFCFCPGPPSFYGTVRRKNRVDLLTIFTPQQEFCRALPCT